MIKMITNTRGAAVLLSMITIASVAMILALALGLSSIIENQINLDQSRANLLLLNTDSCGDEALNRLNRNNSYTGELLDVGTTSCAITVTGSGTTRTIDIAADNAGYFLDLEIGVTIYPTFSVDSWKQL
jgi:hypothetical protein